MGDCGEIHVIYKYTDIHNPHICNIVIIIACLNQHCPSILGRTAEATAVFGWMQVLGPSWKMSGKLSDLGSTMQQLHLSAPAYDQLRQLSCSSWI